MISLKMTLSEEDDEKALYKITELIKLLNTPQNSITNVCIDRVKDE
jgi:hypothetical protein